MSWTKEQVKILIGEIEKYPMLYNYKHAEYYNRNSRRICLKQIVGNLSVVRPKTTKTEVLKKWNGLRSTYGIERKKYLESIESGAGSDQIYKPSLFYYHKLKYLDDYLAIRKQRSSFDFEEKLATERNSEEPEREEKLHTISQGEGTVSPKPGSSSMDMQDFCKVENEYLNDTDSPESCHPSYCSSTRKKMRFSDETLEDAATEILQEISQLAKNISVRSDDSDDEMYGKCIGRKLASIKNAKMKLNVRHKIETLLHQAELQDM